MTFTVVELELKNNIAVSKKLLSMRQLKSIQEGIKMLEIRNNFKMK